MSMTRPRTNGPRSLIVTTTERPLLLLGYGHLAAEWQAAVCSGERCGGQFLPACGFASAFRRIDRGNAGPSLCECVGEMKGRKLTNRNGERNQRRPGFHAGSSFYSIARRQPRSRTVASDECSGGQLTGAH